MAKAERNIPSLTDRVWKQIEGVLKQVRTRLGAPTKLSDRMFLEALLHRAKTHCPWRGLPAEYGDWNAVYQRYRRWKQRGLWRALKERLPEQVGKLIDAIAAQEPVRPSPLRRRARPKAKAAAPKRRAR